MRWLEWIDRKVPWPPKYDKPVGYILGLLIFAILFLWSLPRLIDMYR